MDDSQTCTVRVRHNDTWDEALIDSHLLSLANEHAWVLNAHGRVVSDSATSNETSGDTPVHALDFLALGLQPDSDLVPVHLNGDALDCRRANLDVRTWDHVYDQVLLATPHAGASRGGPPPPLTFATPTLARNAANAHNLLAAETAAKSGSEHVLWPVTAFMRINPDSVPLVATHRWYMDPDGYVSSQTRRHAMALSSTTSTACLSTTGSKTTFGRASPWTMHTTSAQQSSRPSVSKMSHPPVLPIGLWR